MDFPQEDTGKKGTAMNVQLKKGVMEIVVLSMLRRKEYYGYELVTDISRYIEMSEGTIYPLLSRFKKDGITPAGQDEYEESVREWNQFTKAVDTLLQEGGNTNESN